MALIQAVVTDEWRLRAPQMFANQTAFSLWATFRVGEGGWVDPGTGRVRRQPDPLLTNLDALGLQYPGRYPADSQATFSKAFIAGDFTFVSPTTMKIRCLLDFGDFNDDGFGNSPEIWELGIFDAAGKMAAYGTFTKQVKSLANQLENFVRIVF